MAIIADLKDPRVKDATVTMVEVSPDMRQAKVHVSVMGDDVKQHLCLKGLQSSAGYLQSKIGNRIDTRYTPRIEFVLDKGIKNAMTVARILEEVLPQEGDQGTQADHADKENGSAESDFDDSSSPTAESSSQDADAN